jgi:hypothetical protein
VKEEVGLVIMAPGHFVRVFADLGEFPWSKITIKGFPVPLLGCFGKTDDGRLVCTGLLLDPRSNTEITARILREIPIGRILTVGNLGLLPGYVRSAKPYRPQRVKSGPKGWPREHFVKVAESYRQVLMTHPRTPIRALARQLQRSEPTVHRWLQRARDLGLLPASRLAAAPLAQRKRARGKR